MTTRLFAPQSLLTSLGGVVTLLTALSPLVSQLMAEDWPRWRGPSADGISKETGLAWDKIKAVPAWTAKVGEGFSGMSVVGGKLYTMGLKDGKEIVYCLDAATGKEVWTYSWPTEFKALYYEGGTSATPTVDDGRVFVFGQSGDMVALDAAKGSLVWQVNLKKKLSLRQGTWGFTGAPLIVGSRIIVNAGSHGVALEKATGKVDWSSDDDEAGYATPVLAKIGNEEQVVLFAAKKVSGVLPATGKEAWSVKWRTSYDVNAADPVIIGPGKFFVSSGYGNKGGVVSVDGSTAKIDWENKLMKCQMNGAVFLNGHLFGYDGNAEDKGGLVCLEATTGKEKWRAKELSVGGVTAADGKVVAITGTGELVVCEASDKAFTVIEKAQVIDGKCWTVPTIANGTLYVRNWGGKITGRALSGAAVK